MTNIGLIFIYTSQCKIPVFQYHIESEDILYYILFSYAREYIAGILYDHSNIITYEKRESINLISIGIYTPCNIVLRDIPM